MLMHPVCSTKAKFYEDAFASLDLACGWWLSADFLTFCINMKSQKNESTRLFSTKEPMQQYYIRYLTSNQGGGLLSPNVATNAAIYLRRSIRR